MAPPEGQASPLLVPGRKQSRYLDRNDLLLLTGGSDGERVKGWSVPDLKFVSSIMPDRDDFITGDEVLDICTHGAKVSTACLFIY